MASWWNDYTNNVLQGNSLSPVGAATTRGGGAGVDMRGAQEGLHADLLTGTVTDGTHTVKLQESRDDGVTDPYTDILDDDGVSVTKFADFVTGGQDDDKARSLNFKRTKRFVRAFHSSIAPTLGAEFSVAIHGMKRRVL